MNWISKNKHNLFLCLLLIIGFFVRTFLVDKISGGDLQNYIEWGQRFNELGPKNLYFTDGWYYSTPVYPPISILMLGGLNYLYQHKYVLAQMHNAIKFPPAIFIQYFYEWGNVLLIKLPSIICDLGISLLVYKVVLKLTKKRKRAIGALLFYLFNPLTIFISGIWGQTDSIVAFFGLFSFLTLMDGNPILSMPLLFISIYFKPSWAILAPFYLFILINNKTKFTSLLFGGLICLILFYITTAPFSVGNVFSYGLRLFQERYPLPIGVEGKASISAFNFQTIFLRLDIDYAHVKLLGIKSGSLGFVLYLFANLFSFINFSKQKNKLFGMVSGLFVIGMGSFLFMATMLERYFFPALAPIIILCFTRPDLVWNLIIGNLIFILNIIYSFYRRDSDEIARPFVNNEFLLIRTLSLVQVLNYLYLAKKLLSQDQNKV